MLYTVLNNCNYSHELALALLFMSSCPLTFSILCCMTSYMLIHFSAGFLPAALSLLCLCFNLFLRRQRTMSRNSQGSVFLIVGCCKKLRHTSLKCFCYDDLAHVQNHQGAGGRPGPGQALQCKKTVCSPKFYEARLVSFVCYIRGFGCVVGQILLQVSQEREAADDGVM